jgi:hypothetical protein
MERFLEWTVTLSSLLLILGCGGRLESPQPRRLSLAQSEVIARGTLQKEGFDPDRYRALPHLDTNQGQWVFVFQLSASLRPPGSDLVVWVNQTNGHSHLMRGQ